MKTLKEYNVQTFKAVGVEAFKNKSVCFLVIFQGSISSSFDNKKVTKKFV